MMPKTAKKIVLVVAAFIVVVFSVFLFNQTMQIVQARATTKPISAVAAHTRWSVGANQQWQASLSCTGILVAISHRRNMGHSTI